MGGRMRTRIYKFVFYYILAQITTKLKKPGQHLIIKKSEFKCNIFPTPEPTEIGKNLVSSDNIEI